MVESDRVVFVCLYVSCIYVESFTVIQNDCAIFESGFD